MEIVQTRYADAFFGGMDGINYEKENNILQSLHLEFMNW